MNNDGKIDAEEFNNGLKGVLLNSIKDELTIKG